METFSALLAICTGNSPAPGELPTQRPVTRSIDVFFVLRLNKRLSKQCWGWWFETLSRLLWRHRNDSQSIEFGEINVIKPMGFCYDQMIELGNVDWGIDVFPTIKENNTVSSLQIRCDPYFWYFVGDNVTLGSLIRDGVCFIHYHRAVWCSWQCLVYVDARCLFY